MLHARKFSLRDLRMSTAQIVRNNQSQYRVAEKLQCFVVQLSRLFLIARGDLFVRPGTMSHRTFEQSPIAKVISDG